MSLPDKKILESVGASVNEQVIKDCQLAEELEDAGDYDGAVQALSSFWDGIGERPNTTDLSPEAKAELLLRAGTLTSWIGYAKSLEGAQEAAKNLLSESQQIFVYLGQSLKANEAQLELGCSYWREGSLNEARDLLQELLPRISASRELTARTLLNLGIIEDTAAHHQAAYAILLEAAPLFEALKNPMAKGKFHNSFALVLKNLYRLEGREEFADRAIMEFTAASIEFEQAGLLRYVAYVENNIGQLYYSLQRYDDALEHLQRARRIFVSLKATGSVAQVNETRARVLLALNRLTEAEAAAADAVHTQENGDSMALLTEALTTHGTALARLGKYQQAKAAFLRASQKAEYAGDREASARAHLQLIAELKGKLPKSEMVASYKAAHELLRHTTNRESITRLLSAAQDVIEALNAEVSIEDLLIGGSLEEEVRHFEGTLIKRALEKSNGRITEAARSLGVSHQGLDFILRGRQKELLAARKPRQKRYRSIITKPKK